MVTGLFTDKKVSGSIPCSAMGLFSRYVRTGCVLSQVFFVHVLRCAGFGVGRPCTPMTTGHFKHSSCVRVPICGRQKLYPVQWAENRKNVG